MINDNILSLIVYEHVERLGAFASLAQVDGRENDISIAYEALRDAALLAIADPVNYSERLVDYIGLVVLGNPDSLLPAFLSEIELVELDSKIQLATASILVSGYAVLLLDQTYASRPDAVRARSVLSLMVDYYAEAIGDKLGFSILSEFLMLTGNVSEELSRIAASQVPLVCVEVGVALPSTLLAYRLYEDPERAFELTSRNKVATPAYMPVKFEALSS